MLRLASGILAALALFAPASVASKLPDGACYIADGAALEMAEGHGNLERMTLWLARSEGASHALVTVTFGASPRAQASGLAERRYANWFFCSARLCSGDDDSGRLEFEGPIAESMNFTTDYLGLIRPNDDGTDFTGIDLAEWASPPQGVYRLVRGDPEICIME